MLSVCRRVALLALLVVLPVLAAQVFVGRVVGDDIHRAWLIALAFAVLVMMLTRPGAILVLALPATYLYYRVGPASTDISLADVSLGVALVVALPFVPWRAPTMHRMLRILVVYLLVLAFPVIMVSSHRALVEWGHRAFLVGGGILVGSAIAATGRTVAALRAYVAVSFVVAVAAIADAIGHWVASDGFAPAYPFGIQKNEAGFLLAVALLALIIVPGVIQIPNTGRRVAIAFLFFGVVACQARGAALVVVGIVAVWAIWNQVRLSPTAIVGAALLIVMTYLAVSAAYRADQPSARFNSVNSRISTYDASLDLWRDDPVVGVGLKYWRDPVFAGDLSFGEPHNLVVSALGESGVIGLAALALLIVGSVAVVLRGRSQLATFAALIIVAKAVDSAVGIFWVAGTLTVAWIVVGLACAPDPTLEVSAQPRPRRARVRR